MADFQSSSADCAVFAARCVHASADRLASWRLTYSFYVAMKTSADIKVTWHQLSEDHPGWSECRCLYAYTAPRTCEILYIGKAWGVTVRGRWNRAAKEKFWEDLERERGIHKHGALFGELQLTYPGRLSSELLSDVESLLIFQEQPWGNIQSRNSRIARPGLSVECVGKWPGGARIYMDNA
jgi:hypothetical protein